MIINNNQEILLQWLCERIELAPTKHIRCIANINASGIILGVVGIDNWNGSSCQIHVAGQGNWLTREFLTAVFTYIFDTAKVKVMLCMIESGNKKSLAFTRRIGWTQIARIEGAHPTGALIAFEMRPENCKYLEPKDGQIYSRAA